jgi:hypothetical protein
MTRRQGVHVPKQSVAFSPASNRQKVNTSSHLFVLPDAIELGGCAVYDQENGGEFVWGRQWQISRILELQLKRMFAHRRQPELQTEYD